ncbi:hypothetical protein HYU92_02270 [Candidatus Curtissbacteria bacterium]|nr:hypothetical protein [Candidatus Curtissbacteria bacterium]
MAKLSFSPVSTLAQAGLSKLAVGFKKTTDSLSDSAGSAMGSATNSLIGGLSALLLVLGGISLPIGIALAIFGVSVGFISLSSFMISDILTPTIFFSKEGDEAGESISETKLAVISKTVTPTKLTNDDVSAGKEATYTITISTKSQTLENIVIDNRTTVSPRGASAFPDFKTDSAGNDITSFSIGTLNPSESRTITYKIFIQGDKYKNATISDTATASFRAADVVNSVSSSAAILVGEPPPPGDCTPASDGNPANGIETTSEELECYIAQVAAGKIEPKSRDNMANVMIRVMRMESGGRQCAAGTAGEIGVFQYIASTWRAGIKSSPDTDSGSGSISEYRSGRSTCWGIPGPDPVAIPPYDPSSIDFNWPTNCGGANKDCGAWDPYAQIDNTVWKMEQGGACIWEAYKKLYPGIC